MIYTRRYRYRFGDIDDAGIAYYPKFFHYYHCCFEDWWSDALGTPYPSVLHDEEFGLPVVSVQADFFSPIRYGDTPDISLGVLSIGTTSVQFGFWMTQPGATAASASARITTVAMHMTRRVKVPVPERHRAAFERYRIDPSEFPSRPDAGDAAR